MKHTKEMWDYGFQFQHCSRLKESWSKPNPLWSSIDTDGTKLPLTSLVADSRWAFENYWWCYWCVPFFHVFMFWKHLHVSAVEAYKHALQGYGLRPPSITQRCNKFMKSIWMPIWTLFEFSGGLQRCDACLLLLPRTYNGTAEAEVRKWMYPGNRLRQPAQFPGTHEHSSSRWPQLCPSVTRTHGPLSSRSQERNSCSSLWQFFNHLMSSLN